VSDLSSHGVVALLRSEGPSPAVRRASPGWAQRGLGVWIPPRRSAARATHSAYWITGMAARWCGGYVSRVPRSNFFAFKPRPRFAQPGLVRLAADAGPAGLQNTL